MARMHWRPRERQCFTPGNFIMDATVCPSHGRPCGHRPTFRPLLSAWQPWYKLSIFIVSEMCDKPKMYSNDEEWNLKRSHNFFFNKIYIYGLAKFIIKYGNLNWYKSWKILEVGKLAKLLLCDYNFTPPYHENTRHACCLAAHCCKPRCISCSSTFMLLVETHSCRNAFMQYHLFVVAAHCCKPHNSFWSHCIVTSWLDFLWCLAKSPSIWEVSGYGRPPWQWTSCNFTWYTNAITALLAFAS
jgi:hypothetical protein